MEKEKYPKEEKSLLFSTLSLAWGEGTCVDFCVVWGEGATHIQKLDKDYSNT